MKLYIVSHWVPDSEYGGVEIFTANNDQEVVDLMIQSSLNMDKQMYKNYKELIEKCVADALVYHLDPEREEPEVEKVYSFVT